MDAALNLEGIIFRLRQMLRRNEPMTEIQRDLVAIEAFVLCRAEGLEEFIISEAWIIPFVPEAMARHGCPQLGAVLAKVRDFFPPEAASAPPRDWPDHVRAALEGRDDQIIALDVELAAIKEDHEAAVAAIGRDRAAELPEPLQMIPGYWDVNPFTGQKKYFKPRYPL